MTGWDYCERCNSHREFVITTSQGDQVCTECDHLRELIDDEPAELDFSLPDSLTAGED